MPQKSKTRKHADIISSLTFDDAGNLTGFENPESVTLPGLEVTGQSIFNGNVGVVGNTVFTGSTIDIKQGGIFLGSDSDSFNGTAIFYGTDSDDVWTNFGTTNQVGKTYLRGSVDIEGSLNVKSSGTITFMTDVNLPNLTFDTNSVLTANRATINNLTCVSGNTIGATTVAGFSTFTIQDTSGSAQFTGKTFA